ncbi:hypothetical protein [Cryptosporangium sp. NPDC051539]|uniref:hypothetical protein n=1 Tax=Cryptosporangium sp. NPDC051539 TaxID=3363962 RepID=UPI00378F0A1B
MVDDNDELRARPSQLRDYADALRDHEAPAVVTELGVEFQARLADGHRSLAGTGTSDDQAPVMALVEATFLAGVLDANAQAVGLFLADVNAGLNSLADGATAIADHYGEGDALSSATVEDVISAFTPTVPKSSTTGETPVAPPTQGELPGPKAL